MRGRAKLHTIQVLWLSSWGTALLLRKGRCPSSCFLGNGMLEFLLSSHTKSRLLTWKIGTILNALPRGNKAILNSVQMGDLKTWGLKGPEKGMQVL